MQKILITLLLIFNSTIISPEPTSQLNVWNVGQGQWITWSTPTECYHIDTGGEFAPWGEILKLCQTKTNRLLYTHWDWDHINQLQKMKYKLSHICLEKAPPGRAPSSRKEKLFQGLSQCSNSAVVSELKWTPDKSKKTTNDMSRIFIVTKSILISGDSPSKQEKRWADAVPHGVKYFIVGHHGSKYSNSNYLLKKLRNLKLAIVSARKKRYGHPHFETLKRFGQIKTPVLNTENWGHIKVVF